MKPTLASRIGCAALTGLLLLAGPACAQQVVATVNDSPVTDYDIDQRARLHRALRLPFERNIAIDGIIEDKLKIIETKKFKIQAGEAEIVDEIGKVARELRMPTEALSAEMQRAGVDAAHVREHFGAQFVWKVYTRSLNKTLDVSERQVRAELAKRGLAGGAEFTLRQIFVVVPPGSPETLVRTRLRDAETIRTRFTDCASGAAFATQMLDVAVKDPIVRTDTALTPAIVKELAGMQVGRVTRPQRVQSGFEMLALCARGVARDGVDKASEQIRMELLDKRYEQEGDKLYRKVRQRAVVVKR